MVDFKQAKFGDKFMFKPTGEVCEYISSTECSAHLRPIDYDGLMVYSEVFGCHNEKTNWEIYEELNGDFSDTIIDVSKPADAIIIHGIRYIRDKPNQDEDDWNLIENYTMGVPKIDSESIETLKEKILEDITKELFNTNCPKGKAIYKVDINNEKINNGRIYRKRK